MDREIIWFILLNHLDSYCLTAKGEALKTWANLTGTKIERNEEQTKRNIKERLMCK